MNKINNDNINEKEELLSNNIYFHKNFSELVDMIHFSLYNKIGLIIEGMKGQGKKTAINYIANLLEYNVLNIYLNESTKIEDLLGNLAFENDNNEFKMQNVKTDFIKTLESEKYSIIIFHNLNKANTSIIELITNFYRKKKGIYNIHLNTINPKYNNIFFISIFNYENSIKGQDFLPHSLVQNSIYFQMDNNAIDHIRNIIYKQFEYNKLDEEYTKFTKTFMNVYDFDKKELNESNESILSLNEIDKFIKLKKKTIHLNTDIILAFIFIFRYFNNIIQEKIKNILKFGNLDFNLNFIYNDEKVIIEILMNGKENNTLSLTLPLNKNNHSDKKKIHIEINDIKKDIISLTLPQRYCLLFLACSYLSNKPCILQGETSSGKTHLILLFAKMLGKKLNIYQMNNDSNIIMINGQSIFEDITTEEINELRILKNELEDLLNINFNNKQSEIKVGGIKKLLEQANEYLNKNNNEDEKEKIIKLKNKILKIISPINRFKYHKSSFCESLENGEWVLIEQIESAPSEVLERLIPLTLENPEIKIIQGTKEIIYKLNVNKDDNILLDHYEEYIKEISPEFRIFFTYNPDKADIKINQNLLDNCLTFTLP